MIKTRIDDHSVDAVHVHDHNHERVDRRKRRITEGGDFYIVVVVSLVHLNNYLHSFPIS